MEVSSIIIGKGFTTGPLSWFSDPNCIELGATRKKKRRDFRPIITSSNGNKNVYIYISQGKINNMELGYKIVLHKASYHRDSILKVYDKNRSCVFFLYFDEDRTSFDKKYLKKPKNN